MIKFIENILNTFRPCFSRKATFNWFVIIVIGFMLRSDSLGLTSIIRDLALNSNCYESMLHFFRASSWSLNKLKKSWYNAVLQSAPLHKVNGCNILIGDGVKQSKEGRFMPAVKRLFQESENSAKPEYMFGHMFGGLGVLAGNLTKFFCIPLSIRLHDGLQAVENWDNSEQSTTSHIVSMIQDAICAAKTFGDSILLLDRYFLSVPALKELNEYNKHGQDILDIVTKAKSNCKAYQKAPAKKPGRGRPAKKGETIYLKDLFLSRKHLFNKSTITLYGKMEQVRYYSINLLWGQQLYQELRFVLVEYGTTKAIFASTNLTLDPIKIIELYSYRFKIESMFRELKQQIGCFCYHFWSKHMPKLNKYQKKDTVHPLEKITDKHVQKKILDTVRAIESYVMISIIAMGTLQVMSLKFSNTLNVSEFRYMRTPSNKVVSEATMMCYLRKYFFHFIAKSPHLAITQIITNKQNQSEFLNDSQAS